MAKAKLISRKKILKLEGIESKERTSGDTLKDYDSLFPGMNGKDPDRLEMAKTSYKNLDNFRQRRRRTIRFIYGDQLADQLLQKDGSWKSLREKWEQRLGTFATQDNHMTKIEDSMEGLYAKGQGRPTVYANNDLANEKTTALNGALQDNYDRNIMNELLASEWRECLYGGLPVAVTEWRCEHDQEDVYTYPINPDYFFYSSRGNDPRMWDVYMVGEIRDYVKVDLAIELSNGGNCKKIMDALTEIYKHNPYVEQGKTWEQQTDINKFTTWEQAPHGYMRTYHVWTKEGRIRYRCVDVMDENQPLYKIELEDIWHIQEENKTRLQDGEAMGFYVAPETRQAVLNGESPAESDKETEIPFITFSETWDNYWLFTMLAPDGTILKQEESPYAHKSHPYSFIACKYINGDIIPFMSQHTDQQMIINEYSLLKRLMVERSIKGLKMMPTTLLGGMSPKEFADMSFEVGEWLFYTPNAKYPDAKPEIINASIDVTGVDTMLELQMRNMSDMYNNNDSIRGKAPSSGTPYSSFALQTENATTSLVSGLNTFNVFENALATKVLQMMLQYYQSPRYVSNPKSNGLQDLILLDPKTCQDLQWFAKVRSSADSPMAMAELNVIASEMRERGDLDAIGQVEASSFRGKEIILQALKDTRERMQQATQGQGTGAEPAAGASEDAIAAEGASAPAVGMRNTTGEGLSVPPQRYPTISK